MSTNYVSLGWKDAPEVMMCLDCGADGFREGRPHFCKVENMRVLERLALAVEALTYAIHQKQMFATSPIQGGTNAANR